MGNNRINQIDLVDAVYEKLVLSNLNDIKGAVECVAETFSGININGTVRSEPMNVALKLDKKTIESFLNKILKVASASYMKMMTPIIVIILAIVILKDILVFGLNRYKIV